MTPLRLSIRVALCASLLLGALICSSGQHSHSHSDDAESEPLIGQFEHAHLTGATIHAGEPLSQAICMERDASIATEASFYARTRITIEEEEHSDEDAEEEHDHDHEAEEEDDHDHDHEVVNTTATFKQPTTQATSFKSKSLAKKKKSVRKIKSKKTLRSKRKRKSTALSTSKSTFRPMAEDATLLEEEHDHVHWHVTPDHPVCANSTSEWIKLSGDSLMRNCDGVWIHLTAVAETAATEHASALVAGIVVSVQYANGGYCSTHLSKIEEDEDSASASAKTWWSSTLAVAMSCVVSLVGILFMSCHRALVQKYMTELLALSCGTFLGSIIFSLMPETATELGFDIKITAVLLGGILFAMLSETLIHSLGHLCWKPRSPIVDAADEDVSRDSDVEMADVKKDASPTPLIQIAPAPVRDMCAEDATAAKCASDCEPASADLAINCKAAAAHQDDDTCGAVFHDDAATGEACDQMHAAHHVTVHVHHEETTNDTKHRHIGESTDHCAEDHSPIKAVTKEKSDGHSHGHSHGGHSHGGDEHEDDSDPRHAALVNCVADGLHNFIDGALIGATFLVSPGTGWTTAVAIAIHELPQELSDFAILTNAGLSVTQALLVNLAVSTTAFAGAFIAIAIGEQFAESVTNILPFAAGLFLYLALTILMPPMMRAKGARKIVQVWLAFGIGIAMMAALTELPWGHSH